MEENRQPIDRKTRIKQLFLALGIIIVVGLVIFFVVKCKDDNKAKHPEASGYVMSTETIFFYATGAAKAIVSNELLYPRNSEFEEEKDFSVYYDKGKGQYTVKGIVYAANGFGTKQKKYFTVILTLGNLDKDNYSYSKVSCSIT